jgi:Tol biopolymer transport system component
LVFSQAGADKSQHLWLLHVSRRSTEQKPTLLHDNPFTEAGGQISPDGRYLAYMSSESGVTDIYVQSFPGPGAKIRISTQGGVSPRWSRNGRELLYWTLARSSLMGVDVETGASFHAGVPHRVLKISSGTTWDIAPDDKKFLIEVFASGTILKMVTVLNWFNELARPAR